MKIGDIVKDKTDGKIGTIIDSFEMYASTPFARLCFFVRWENGNLGCVNEDKLELNETTV